ncbi:MAG: hypothetical protein JO035_11650 [Betaproteobacteria bacterium]|nr:hypothetical protein [Betaproteobacteria bacterium]
MSTHEKTAAPAVDPLKEYTELAQKLFVGIASRVYSAPSAPDQKKPDPKILAAMCFKMADAFEQATKETDRAKAIIEARNKASVKLDEVDLSGVFGAAKK